MADLADIAQAHAETLADTLARYQQQAPVGESLSECEECGNDIPAPRRLAVKGCRLCIDCQSVREAKRKQGVV
ncbi:MAG: TraR/DksA C4-type zinc finger protein [Pseudomonadota bacterium]|nr:TraR/DksA C4-type zinc finger protein [Pseudomonadota bacterium]